MSEQQLPERAVAQGITQLEIDQRVFDLYDEYCHGRIDRREFLSRAAAIAVLGGSGLAMAQALLPRYALAQTISFTDQRIKASYVTYPSTCLERPARCRTSCRRGSGRVSISSMAVTT